MEQTNGTVHYQRRALRTRLAITVGATRLFAEQGYAETSMEDIAIEAGCSKGGLYHHFRTKTEVLTAVARRMASEHALSAPYGASAAKLGLTPDAYGRLLVDLWAEAVRTLELRELELGAGLGAVAQMVAAGGLIDARTRHPETIGDADEAKAA